jgi:serine/threonine protein kinase
MIRREPLFPGDSEIDMLFRIFEFLGRPTEDSWPSCKQLPFWSEQFPNFKSEPLAHRLPELDEAGIDLLRQMLQCDPEQRISADEALRHEYFDDVRHLNSVALTRDDDLLREDI